MRTFRLWLVLLLIALIPARGALAAGLPCGPGGEPASRHAFPAGAEATSHEAASAAASQASPEDGAADCCDGPSTGSDGCALCMAVCAATPLPSASATVPDRLPLAAVRFPTLTLPALSFLSEGQERPPRPA